MIPLLLSEVAAACHGALAGPDGRIDTVTTDSRDAGPRSLFVALPGEHADGHDYVEDALRRGAPAVLVHQDVAVRDATVVRVSDTWTAIAEVAGYVRDRVAPLVVGITGSVGKTTTKDLTAAALGAGRRTVAAPGSYNNELGVPLTLLSLEPDSEAVVVEIGSRGIGHIARLVPVVRPDVGIVTAVAEVHLELFGDIDAVARAKGELVESLPADGTAILNGDDPRVAAMASRTDAQVLRYGVDTSHDLVASAIRLDPVTRPTFEARTPWGTVEVTLPVAGRHQVGNALAALAAAGVAGVALEDAAGALATAPVSSWRGEIREADGIVVLNDAYNSNPTAVAAALDMLTSVEHTGRSWAVLGVMAEIGPTHEQEHERVGRLVAEAGVDRLVVVGDEAAGIHRGAAAAGFDETTRWQVGDAAAALDVLRPRVTPGDVVLVKASRVGGLEGVATGLLGEREVTST